MVSFSCDDCQNVFTKPKIERHFRQCRTRSVSCIDCLQVFDTQTVRAHSSCITEAEKYGPKSAKTNECTQQYCGICALRLNGAVHAVQHYDSKKHRAAQRRLKQQEAAKKKSEGVNNDEERVKRGDKGGDKVGDVGAHVEVASVRKGGKKRLGIKKAIKKILKEAPKQKLKREGLISKLSILLGQQAPPNLGELVDRKVDKSDRFKARKGRISLVS